jgi:hypothetical protein
VMPGLVGDRRRAARRVVLARAPAPPAASCSKSATGRPPVVMPRK